MSLDWDVLFDELVELEPASRERRLAEIEAADANLARRLRALLRADASSASEALTAAAAKAPELLADALGVDAAAQIPDRAGERLGAYRLLRPLGRGGMGEVWLAERADGEFEAKVAIKLIRGDRLGSWSASGDSLHERFLRERQILAELAHPGIARLLDGGRTASGEPYLVLEFVEGEPITDWCRSRSFSAPGRLRLLIEIANAVDFAHRALVVHRDLKPSNVLVDRHGQPKLLDFGIARIVASSRTERPERGVPFWQASALTPAYAAPELVLGGLATTAADVYSLGVLLYELLTGGTPTRRRGASAAELVAEIEREVVPTALPRGRSASNGASLALEMSPRLARDLDAILAKALAKDPAERYGSAAAFAAELQRALEDRPVEARGLRLSDRSGSWLRRHRWIAAALLLAISSLLGGFAVALYQARVARQQALEAREQAARASQIRAFLVSIFETSDPESARGGKKTARELLAEGAARIDRELHADPALRADMLDLLTDLHRKLGLLDEGRRLGEAALATRRSLAASAPADLLRSRASLAWIRLEQGEAAEARAELATVVAEFERLEGPDSPAAAAAREPLVEALFVAEGPEAALPEATRRYEALRNRAGDEDVATALARSDLGVVRLELGRLGEAEEDLRGALAVLAKLLPPDDPRLAYPHYNLGTALDRGGKLLNGAASEFLEALRLRRGALGERHPETGLAWAALAGAQYELGQNAEAEDAARRAIGILEIVDPFSTSQARGTLTDVLMAAGRPREALVEIERALVELGSIVGDRHPLLANFRAVRGRVLVALRRYAEAKVALEQTIAAPGGQKSRWNAWFAFDALATAKRELGEREGLEELRAQARALAVARWGEGSPQVAHVDAEAALDARR